MGSNIRCGLLMPSQPSLALGSLLSLGSWEASAVAALPLPTGSLQPLHHQTLGAEAGCLPALTASLAWNPLTPLGTRWSQGAPQPPPAVWKGGGRRPLRTSKNNRGATVPRENQQHESPAQCLACKSPGRVFTRPPTLGPREANGKGSYSHPR